MGNASYQRNQLGGNADANGNCTLQLQGSYELQRQGAYRLFVQLGGQLNAVVTVLLDGIPVDGGLTTNRQWKAGPVFLQGNSELQVTIVGMSPLAQASCFLDGIISDDVSDFAALGGPGYGGGSVQSDPSQLLSAQIGNPLIENQTYSIPGSGSHNFFAGQFLISGYNALLFYGQCSSPGNNALGLFAWLEWMDELGNSIAFTQIDCLNPQWICFVGALGPQVQVWLGNNLVNTTNVRQVSLIPFTSMPADPGRFIPVQFGALPGSFLNTINPPANAIVSFNASVAAATTQQITGDFVWYGEAYWTVSPVTSGAGGVNTWWAQLQTIDGSGNITQVDVITGQNVGGSNGPRQVFLPPGTPFIIFRNTGAGAITPIITLIAA